MFSSARRGSPLQLATFQFVTIQSPQMAGNLTQQESRATLTVRSKCLNCNFGVLSILQQLGQLELLGKPLISLCKAAHNTFISRPVQKRRSQLQRFLRHTQSSGQIGCRMKPGHGAHGRLEGLGLPARRRHVALHSCLARLAVYRRPSDSAALWQGGQSIAASLCGFCVCRLGVFPPCRRTMPPPRRQGANRQGVGKAWARSAPRRKGTRHKAQKPQPHPPALPCLPPPSRACATLPRKTLGA